MVRLVGVVLMGEEDAIDAQDGSLEMDIDF
jgi:hypothetical protein